MRVLHTTVEPTANLLTTVADGDDADPPHRKAPAQPVDYGDRPLAGRKDEIRLWPKTSRS
jgi:hypothetical protein